MTGIKQQVLELDASAVTRLAQARQADHDSLVQTHLQHLGALQVAAQYHISGTWGARHAQLLCAKLLQSMLTGVATAELAETAAPAAAEGGDRSTTPGWKARIVNHIRQSNASQAAKDLYIAEVEVAAVWFASRRSDPSLLPFSGSGSAVDLDSLADCTDELKGAFQLAVQRRHQAPTARAAPQRCNSAAAADLEAALAARDRTLAQQRAARTAVAATAAAAARQLSPERMAAEEAQRLALLEKRARAKAAIYTLRHTPPPSWTLGSGVASGKAISRSGSRSRQAGKQQVAQSQMWQAASGGHSWSTSPQRKSAVRFLCGFII